MQEQECKQINAGVFLLINEVNLFIYRFLTSGDKKIKKQPQSVELGSTSSLAIGALNALASYRCFDWTLIEGRPRRQIP